MKHTTRLATLVLTSTLLTLTACGDLLSESESDDTNEAELSSVRASSTPGTSSLGGSQTLASSSAGTGSSSPASSANNSSSASGTSSWGGTTQVGEDLLQMNFELGAQNSSLPSAFDLETGTRYSWTSSMGNEDIIDLYWAVDNGGWWHSPYSAWFNDFGGATTGPKNWIEADIGTVAMTHAYVLFDTVSAYSTLEALAERATTDDQWLEDGAIGASGVSCLLVMTAEGILYLVDEVGLPANPALNSSVRAKSKSFDL